MLVREVMGGESIAMDEKDKCPVPGCGRAAKGQFVAEEILMPASMLLVDLERKPPFDVVARNFLVKCPIHGLMFVQVEGHHITDIPRKPGRRAQGTLAKMVAIEKQRVDAIRHVVHEYANFVSSSEMVQNGLDIDRVPFKPPINTHVSHAFYLNCRKLADFFQNRGQNGDIMVCHYVPSFQIPLPVSNDWRSPIDKQLAHMTYARDKNPREIDGEACKSLYVELRDAWRAFRRQLARGPYEAEFNNQLNKRKEPYPDGTPSEFRLYDLD
jgi:hypothetical protein